MKALHFGTLDTTAGGPAMSTYFTLKGLRRIGVDAQLLMYDMSRGGKLVGEEIPVHFAKSPWEHKLAYSPSLKRAIRECGDFDIYHAQGVWQYPTYAMVDVARKQGKPYIITPRGMLYPQDIAKNSTFFKKLSLKWRLLKDLNKAACVHTTCKDEMMYCRDLGVKSPIAIIPNPIEIKDYPAKKADKTFRLGYLGRLSKRKNVEGLIYAWHSLQDMTKNAELLIIGGGDDSYDAFLKGEVKRLGLTNVRFTGFLNGEEKNQAIASFSVLAMPSEFENLGNVILEGLIRRIPCIATKGSPWEELETHHCGWWVDYSQEAITEAVGKALSCSDQQLQQMGENGRRLVEENYAMPVIAQKMLHLYEWVINGGEKPDFVYLDE